MNFTRKASIFWLLSFVEMWERFSYIGMRTLLVLYLTSALKFSDTKTYAVFGLFAAIGYAVPVFAGLISDRLIGFQRTLIIGSSIMCIGHLLMTLTVFDGFFVYPGLGCIATGTGFFKGNIHNLLGAVHRDKDSHQRDKIFSLFNISINLGGLISAIVCGYVAHHFGWHYGFGLAGVGMFLGLGVFLRYRHILGDKGLEPNQEQKKYTAPLFFAISISVFISFVSVILLYYSEISLNYFGILGVAIFVMAGNILYNCDSKQRTNIIFLMILLFFLICFAAIQMQLGSLINLFVARNVDKMLFGYLIPSAVLQGLNPLFVIIFGFLSAGALAKYGYNFYIKRFALGLTVNISCFICLYLGCVYANSGEVALSFLFIGMALMSFAEVCLFPMLKVLFITLSPLQIRGFMMGFFMFGMSYSNLASIFIAKFISVPSQFINDQIVSLSIYKEGFLNIILFNFLVFILFIIAYPFLNKVLESNKQY
jgi:POT family proton-dependent oligopeptide transporter